MAQRHLSDRELAGFLDHDLSGDERRRVEIHLDQCASCRSELVASRRLVDDYARLASPKTAARFARRWWVPAAVAAGLATLLLVPRHAKAPSSEPTGATRVVDGEGTPRIAVVSPAENATLARNAVVLVWHPMTADQYQIAVLTEAGDVAWSGETTDTTMRLPATVLASGRAYFWRVDAIANGISATTGAHRLLIGP